MPQARRLGKTYGCGIVAAQIRVVASGSIVCFYHGTLYFEQDTYRHVNRFENFDEYTRRQYNAKSPHLVNPFGYDEEPNKFRDFDVFLKLKVLHQLTLWTLWNPDRIRERMPEQRETDQTQWVCCA
jgi:hypothetical protein